VAARNIPFSAIDDDDFRDFVRGLSAEFTVPRRTKLTELVDDMFTKMEGSVLQALKEAEFISLTTDSATTVASDSMNAVTAHFITKDWQLKSFLLALGQIDGSHTGEMLKSVVDAVVERWRCFGKVFGIATDGAANIIKAVKELQKDDVIEEGQRCVCHNMHLVVCAALDDPDAKPLVTKARAIANLFKNSQIFRDALSKAQRDRYVAQQAAAPLEEVERALDALGDIILEQTSAPRPKKALMDCVTRWWSCWRMLVRLCEIREDISNIMNSTGKNADNLTDSQWQDLALMCKILRPFADVIKGWEGEKYVTLSRVWPFAWSLQQALEKNLLNGTNIKAADRLPSWSTVTQAKFPASYALRRALRSELAKEDRFGRISLVMKLATALDPRTKDLDTFGDEQLDLIRDALIDAVQGLLPPSSPEAEGGDEEEEEVEGEEENPVGILDALLTAQKKKRRRAKKSSSSVEDEVARYLEEDSTDDPDPLHWWKQKEYLFPRIARLARKYLALPASSAPSERIFSKMNVVCDKRRASLDPERVERMVFIKENKAKVA
jgi:hypothetical protein